MTVYQQEGYEVRFDWGEEGAAALAEACDVLVVIDVLTFTTTVGVAVARGAVVLPYRLRDGGADAFARAHDALLAVPRREVGEGHPYSLSPATVAAVPAGTRIVLASPNGATVTTAAAGGRARLIAASLRNAAAAAAAARSLGGVVGVVAAGERWPDGALRPAFEDVVGAGAVIDRLGPDGLSPEALSARAAFAAARHDIPGLLAECASGRELIAAGYPDDVRLAAEVEVSRIVPLFDGTAFRAFEP